MTLWAGLILGLLAFQAARPGPLSPPTAIEAVADAPDPWAESRRSRALLEGQEGSVQPQPVPQGGGATPMSPKGVRVIDGDTFHYRGERIRIADIDTPEVAGRCAGERALAGRATRRLAVLLAESPFELHPLASGRDTDRYGRKLRIVVRDGRSVGDTLVGEGLARTWTGRREPWCA
jgi:endonuclease YncB( thermonuclease family)